MPRPPVWAVVVLGIWLLLVLGGVLLEQRGATPLETCLLHRLTGHPCPTCGSTRVVMTLARGAWIDALRLNPLMALGFLLASLWMGLRTVTARMLTLELSPPERRVALILGVGLLLANWAWVLRIQA